MDPLDAKEFLQAFFDRLFIRHDLGALDESLDPDYFDDDIGDPSADHIANSKEFLKALWQREPEMRVQVAEVSVHDDVICAFLEWIKNDNGKTYCFYKGVAIFVMTGNRILKRHTFIYEKNTP